MYVQGVVRNVLGMLRGTKMTREEIKKNADDMACKIFEFLELSEKDEEERNKRFIELACSFVTATLDVESDNILDDINKCCDSIRKISLAGVLRYKMGNKERVLKESWKINKEKDK